MNPKRTADTLTRIANRHAIYIEQHDIASTGTRYLHLAWAGETPVHDEPPEPFIVRISDHAEAHDSHDFSLDPETGDGNAIDAITHALIRWFEPVADGDIEHVRANIRRRARLVATEINDDAVSPRHHWPRRRIAERNA